MAIADITRAGVVLPVHVDPRGLDGPTPKAVRNERRWRRTGRGWYVDAAADQGHPDQRVVEALAGLPSAAAVTGWAALWWLGARWFTGTAPNGRTLLPVPIAVGDRRLTAQSGARTISEDWLFAGDVTVVDGLRITVPHRSLAYETRRAGFLDRAVRAIDMAAYDDLIDVEGFGNYVARLVARPGVRLTRRAVPLARENAWSPPEVDMRLAWQAAVPEAGLLCNVPVFDPMGNHLFTPDLLDPVAGIAGEYNGRIHLEQAPYRRDLDKEAAYRQHGIESVTMMSPDLRDHASFVRRLHAAYSRASARSSAGTWTLTQPGWWVDTSTVARRRSLSESEREIWLRRRRT